jgi:hypothetical protein
VRRSWVEAVAGRRLSLSGAGQIQVQINGPNFITRLEQPTSLQFSTTQPCPAEPRMRKQPEDSKVPGGFRESCVKNALWGLPHIQQVRYAAHIRESGQREKHPFTTGMPVSWKIERVCSIPHCRETRKARRTQCLTSADCRLCSQPNSLALLSPIPKLASAARSPPLVNGCRKPSGKNLIH